MSTTKPDTETGWKKFPRADGYYWWAISGEVRLLEVIHSSKEAWTEGDDTNQWDKAYHWTGKFLGPISPSDFEQLLRLRDWKESAMTLLPRYDGIAETFGGKLGSSKIDNLERGVKRLRKAVTLCAIPYEALLADSESRKWIAPEVWAAIENAVAALREALANTGEQS